MDGKLEISGRLLARNTLFNLIGQAVPLLVGVVTIPLIVRGLGAERFGLLSLAWVILGYFTVFDLGLGRATTKFVAEALGKGEEVQVPRIVWTAVVVQSALGLLGALVLVTIMPLLVERILNIPPKLVSEAKATFYLLALAVPIVLVSGSFSGALEAAQRFDLVNAVRIPSSISTHLLTLIGLLLGMQLPGIVALILTSRFISLLALMLFNFQVFSRLKRFSPNLMVFTCLFSYGSFVTVTSIVGPILEYLDRFLIASLVSISAVGYYTAPYQVVTRLWIIPGSFASSLFPAFSALAGMEHSQKFEIVFARSTKYVTLILGPIVIIFIIFARDVLKIWLGDDFAAQTTNAMQILALGVLTNSLAWIPFTALQGIGRPDITAKFHLLELPVYAGTAWVLVRDWGIVGAAAAWTFRVMLDALLLFGASFKQCRVSPKVLLGNGLAFAWIALLLLGGAMYGLKTVGSSIPLLGHVILSLVVLGGFAWLSWQKILDNMDRNLILGMIKR